MDLSETSGSQSLRSRHPWEISRFMFVSSLIDRYVNITQPTRVLDMGCGDLYVARMLLQKHPDFFVEGVDPALSGKRNGPSPKSSSPKAIRLWSKFSDTACHDSRVKLVLMLDVLEHIENDWAFLQNLIKNPNLDDNCLFVVTVPAFQWLYCSHDELLGHYRRYTIDLLCNTLESANLKVLEAGHLYLSAFLLRSVTSFLERKSLISGYSETAVSQWKGQDAISRILSLALHGENKLIQYLNNLGCRLPGLSCYAVAKLKKNS